MFMGLGMPIPDLSNKPGPGRPGFGPTGAFEFKLEVEGTGDFGFNASKAGGGTSFTIDWGDGTIVDNQTASTHAHTYSSAGPHIIQINSENDSGPINTFQVIGTQTNKNKLKKVLNWGSALWNNLNSAFLNCQGLTNIDKSDFLSSSAVNLSNAFMGCFNLTTVDFTGWKASGNVTGANMFRDCTALQSFKLKGSINFANASLNNYWFRDSGSSTGCLFEIENLDFTGSTGNQGSVQGWFYDTQIKNGSKFDNWSFPAANWALNQFFYDAHVPGNDATISIQNWTLPSNGSTSVNQLFRNLQTDAGSGTNLTLNMSNWNFGNITGLVSFMQNARMSSIVGLSTWTANNLRNINNFFATTASLGIDANDNFTTSFWNNSNISNCNFAFQSLGGNTTSATAGAFPALNGMTVASGANFQQVFENTHFNSDASFTGVTFPSTAINFSLAFYTAEFFNSNSTIDFSSSNLKSSTYNTTFRRCTVDNIVFGSNVDFSAVTSWFRMFKADTGDTSYPDQNVTFPFYNPSVATNISFASATDTREFPNIPFTTCQADNLIRALYATKPSAGGNASTFDLTTSAITASPSVVNELKDNLVTNGWNITINSTDAALPFAYPAYMIDPDTGTTSNTPSLLPPVADRNFTSTNASITVNQTTGVLNWAAGVEGFTTVRCTYADGCYNEVSFGIQVPFTLEILVPYNVTLNLLLQGNYYVDYGDGTAENRSGSLSHAYTIPANSGFGVWTTIKVFDQSLTRKFAGIDVPFGYNTNPMRNMRANVLKWGDVIWEKFNWTNNLNVLSLRNASNDYPKFGASLTTFRQSNGDPGGFSWKDGGLNNRGNAALNTRFRDPNNSLASWKISTATGSLGNITSLKGLFSMCVGLGESCINDRNSSNMNWSIPAGTTAPAGVYNAFGYNTNIFLDYGKAPITLSGSGSNLGMTILVQGTGTVTLDYGVNCFIIPNYRKPGKDFQTGDQIRFNVNSWGGAGNPSQAITCTLTADDILNESNTISDFGAWDTSNVEDMSELFTGNITSYTTRTNKIKIDNWDTSSVKSFKGIGGGFNGQPVNLVTLSGSDLTPKIVSSADSPTGSAYVAWDTIAGEDFQTMFYIGDNIPNVLKYWRFNTTNGINMGRFLYEKNLATSVVLANEPCKTQVIPASDATNPYGVDYTAWNMEKVTSLYQFAYVSYTPSGIQNDVLLEPALSSWQISDSLTGFDLLTGSAGAGGSITTLSQNVSAWDPSGLVSGTNRFNYRGNGDVWKFSTTAYNQLLNITTGWGQHASTVNTGVTLNMGASQYSAGGNAEAGKTALINAGWTIIDGGAVFSNTNALSFNGSQHVNVGEDINSTFQGAFSFSCYIWFNNINGSFQSFLTSGFPVQAYIVNGAVQMYLSSTNSNSTETLPTSSTLTAGEWHHVAFTRSGNGANSENKIYLNGVLDVTDTSSTTVTLSTSPINIGASTNPAGSTSLYFNGKIDEVMIWNTVLTQGEVQSYANAVGSGSIPDPNAITGLQLWNRMGD